MKKTLAFYFDMIYILINQLKGVLEMIKFKEMLETIKQLVVIIEKSPEGSVLRERSKLKLRKLEIEMISKYGVEKK